VKHVTEAKSYDRSTSSRQLTTQRLLRRRRTVIPQRLWFDVFRFKGNDHPEKKFEENLRKTVGKYKAAWETDTVKMESLSALTCKNAIMKIPLKGASTDLLKYHLENDPQRHVCRIAVIFLYGGYFLQEEVEVIEPFIAPNEFVSFSAVINPVNELFNGSFLASAAHNPILYRALKKYIQLAKGELKLVTTSRYGEILRSSYREVMAVNPGSKTNMIILSEDRLIDLQKQSNEYKLVKNQDGEGPFCNYVIVDHATKKTYFYTRFAGAHDHQCTEIEPAKQVIAVKPSPRVVPKKEQVIAVKPSPRVVTKKEEAPTIPHTLFFASKHGLGSMKEGDNKHYDNILNTVKAYQTAWDVDNVEYKILDKDFCVDAINKVNIVGAVSVLTDFYLKEVQVDPMRGFDICRAAVLFIDGGYFFNSEVEVIEPYAVMNNVTDFVGVKSNSGLFLPSFVASAPKHPIPRFILMKYILLSEAMLSPETSDQAGEIYRDSYNGQKKDTLSKTVLLQEKHLSMLDEKYDKKSKRSHKCSYVIYDPESKKIYFYTRMYVDGEHCVDEKDE